MRAGPFPSPPTHDVLSAVNDSVGEPSSVYFLFSTGTPTGINAADIEVTDDVGTVAANALILISGTAVEVGFPRDLVRVIDPGTWTMTPDAVTFTDAGTVGPTLTGPIGDA